MAQRAMFNPQNEVNRDVMQENYGIQLPLISDQRPLKTGVSHLISLYVPNHRRASYFCA